MTDAYAANAVTESKRRRRRRSILLLLAGLCVGGLVGGELTARYGMGLGDPPLYVLDPDIEYMLAPSRAYRRFGGTYSVNDLSMRSPAMPRAKASPDELRVLVVGDSIVNGGARVDQSALATEHLRQALASQRSGPVVVGNVSAGSWGPPNELAYLKRFGTLGADVVVFVWNSGDAEDVPGLEAIGTQWPRYRPALALLEVGERAVPGVFGPITGNAPAGPPARQPDQARDEAECIAAIERAITLVVDAGASPAIVVYLSRDELNGQPKPGYATLMRIAEEMNVPVVSNMEAFRHAGQAMPDLFQPDGVHPTAAGQQALAALLEQATQMARAAVQADPSATSPKNAPLTPAPTP